MHIKNGIYCYKDLKNDGELVYIGKDSYIYKNKRDKDHKSKSNYNKQQINRIIQNNPDRYEYEVLKAGDFKKNLLNALEILYIRRYNPKFNYTVGGEGATGYKHSEETKKKLREINTCGYARITNFGKNSGGKKMYVIYRDAKQIKTSINRFKLVNWFTNEYPNEILKLLI